MVIEIDAVIQRRSAFGLCGGEIIADDRLPLSEAARLDLPSAVVGGADFKREVRAFGECLGMHRR
jgi:hypothetical protein